jgi:hypothetical protein
MTFSWKHPSKYKKDKRYFHEVIEEEQKILDIGLKESRRAKKERTESEKMQQELEPINDEVER